jgi:hypothetical protein
MVRDHLTVKDLLCRQKVLRALPEAGYSWLALPFEMIERPSTVADKKIISAF